jgi:large subunit ribosomal protein L4
MANDNKFQAPAFTAKGTSRDKVTLPETLFDGTVHMPAMHQAVKAYLANQRQGTAATRTRGFVTGGNQKPWKQKGTGRARQGSTRAPHWVGGGTVFGPTPRSYAQYVPRQVRALARKSALNARAREDAITVVDALRFEAPKTSTLRALVDKLGGGEKKVLILTNGVNQNVFLSGRNLPNVHVMPYSDVSTYHLLWSDLVVIEEGALTGEAPSAPDAEAQTPDVEHRTSEKTTTARKKAKTARAATKRPKPAAKAQAKAKAKAGSNTKGKPATRRSAAKKKGK